MTVHLKNVQTQIMFHSQQERETKEKWNLQVYLKTISLSILMLNLFVSYGGM